MQRSFTLLPLTLLLAGAADAAAPRSRAIDEALNQVAAGFHTESLHPGYGLCLFDARGPIWSHYQGYANEETRTPFSDRTLFRAGAISEIVTAVRILQLADRGLLDLDRPVKIYLSDVFEGALPGGSLARIGDLPIRTILAHLSGTSANYFLGYQAYRPLQNIRRYLNGTPFRFPPDIKYLHSGTLIDLLGTVIEKNDGKPFEASVREGIFAPLGMTSSSFQYRESPLNASINYVSSVYGSYLSRLPEFQDVQAPSASLQTSLKDLISLYSALLSSPSSKPGSILSSKARTEMFSSKSESAERLQGIHVGYVWMLSSSDLDYLGRIAWSSGKFLSHRNVAILARDLGVGVVIATNAWAFVERDTIFPLAAAVLQKYVSLAFHRQPNPTTPMALRPLPDPLRQDIVGTYVSVYGVFLLESKDNSVFLSTNSSYLRLGVCGQNSLCPVESGEVLKIDVSPPDAISLTLKTGTVAEAVRQSASIFLPEWRKHFGTYRIASDPDMKQTHIFAFTIDSRGDALVATGDDSVEYLLAPFSGDEAEISCNEGSLFFGKPLKVTGPGEILLGTVKYRKLVL